MMQLNAIETPGRRFYERHLALLQEGNADALVDQQYQPDATLVSFDFTVSGRDALLSYFRQYLERLGGITLVSTDRFTETRDSIFFEATVRTNRARVRVYDVFVLRDGRVSHHFTGVISMSPLPTQET